MMYKLAFRTGLNPLGFMMSENTATTALTPIQQDSDASHHTKPSALLLDSILSDDRPVSGAVLAACVALVAAMYALLCTTRFYPLADSSLYLSLARSIADGHGFMFMDIAYKRITPLHPLMLAAIIKLGGGIGAIHAVNIVLMLAAHVLCYLTLRRWFNDRLALLATLATAAQFWVYRNAMFVLTEPPFMLMIWAALLPLSYLSSAEKPRSRWLLIVVSCFFFACAFETRVATALFMPGVVFALWLSNSRVPKFTRFNWISLLFVVFVLLGLEFRRSPYPEGIAPTMAERGTATELARASMSGEERYTLKPFQGVKGGLFRKALTMLLVGGRWINETYVAPAVWFTHGKSFVARLGDLVLSLASLGFLLIGWLVLLKRKSFWGPMLCFYALPFWIIWAMRILPRYLIPIVPFMFIMTVIGMAIAVQFIVGDILKNRLLAARLVGWVPAICLALIILGNLGPYAVEVYVHKILPRDYYDVARQGGVGEVIDIGGYIQKHAEPGDLVYTNGGMPQRVIFYLGGAKTDVPHEDGEKPKNIRVDVASADPRENMELRKFLSSIEPTAKFAVVFSTLDPWPEWYFPLNPPQAQSQRWWFLYERDPKTGRFQYVTPPKDRDYASEIPVSKMIFPTTGPSTKP